MSEETTPPGQKDVCPATLLEVLMYTGEREVPCEAPTDEDDDLPSFEAFKQKMGNQGEHTKFVCIEFLVPGSVLNIVDYILS